MKPLLSAQELARRNNESVAVHAAYEKRRKLRRLLGKKSKRSAKKLDDLDPPSFPWLNCGAASWQAAEREARPVRAVGFFLPTKK